MIADLLVIALAAGMFIAPLYARLQALSAPSGARAPLPRITSRMQGLSSPARFWRRSCSKPAGPRRN
ncbi:hypothetical protein E6W36_12075 [Hankyongella ginsenosidimutans]|uniref:Uncharacterized protein n=1 Tax=Hankyongella ginsenosidimutans TaxID=1763828 RepID=A0A4D7C2Q2_9SPHN|nr:hypothetical protein [Hankyongella ginsenosidimutans]QCI79984.1 hypothetical protein E6W36_12075 [Hankyongella ginsenosidimutans]